MSPNISPKTKKPFTNAQQKNKQYGKYRSALWANCPQEQPNLRDYQSVSDTENREHGMFKLQLTIDYSAKGILDAVVNAIGEPDEEMESIDDILPSA